VTLILIKIRQGNRIVNKASYNVLGINMAGHKDILEFVLTPEYN